MQGAPADLGQSQRIDAIGQYAGLLPGFHSPHVGLEDPIRLGLERLRRLAGLPYPLPEHQVVGLGMLQREVQVVPEKQMQRLPGILDALQSGIQPRLVLGESDLGYHRQQLMLVDKVMVGRGA
ncbi:hypothetical protein D3C84_1033310 [compost metagenome]